MRIKILLFLIVLFTSFESFGQCTISANTNASSLTCGTSPLTACNGILNIGNGTTPITLNMNAALDLSCLGTIQVIVNNATISFQSGNNRLTLAEGSSIIFINGATISDTSCNASERIYIGTNLLASCNGGGGADITFPNLVTQGGTGSVTSNSPVCQGNLIILSATPPPSGGPYTYAWSGPGLSLTTYSSNATYTLTATSSNSGVYTVKMKSSSGVVTEAVVTVTINTGTSTATPTVTLTQPTCTVATGTITITAPTGTGMKYSINGVTYTNTTGVFTSVPAGTYSVTAKNSSGCISSAASVTLVSSSNTWNGSSWSKGTPPTSSERIVFAGNYTSAADLTGCACQVSSGTVVISSGNTLNITNELVVHNGGTLTFEDDSSLVQTNNSAINTGNIIYERETTPLKQYDYTYWSSPVSNAPLSQLATNSLFYSFSPSINNWVWQASTTNMSAGVGYLGRAPSGLNYTTPQIVETSFSGVPNNGLITTPIIKGTSIYNLIGNPYPSAIDIDLFLTDVANSGIVNGTIYLWTHNTAITNNNYTANDYAKYNFTGSVRTATSASTGGALPTGKIAAGQGFFIEANTALANGTYSATFRNSMRVSGNNNQFFRTNTNVVNSGSVSQDLERHRIWLSLGNSEGAYNQMLVGYVQGATNEIDTLYDGKTLPAGNAVSIYTILGNDILSIQGKALPFSTEDIIPIGYSTTINGQLNISLDNFDGVFNSENIYLYDKSTGIYHDLKLGDFSFTTVSGTFNNRFELRFSNAALSVTNPTIADGDIKIVTDNNQIAIYSPLKSIEKIQVFDILGKLIYNQNNLSTTIFETSQLSIAPQMLIVKISLENGQTITKKTLIH